jgi:stringent starvation protein B
MIDAPDTTATRPYLIRALYEWCTDNGFTPYLAVSVDDSVQVPREYVKNGEIVLNISFDATSSLKLGNDFIEFKGRFAGKARDIMVPVCQVIAIYARENGQGMAFPLGPPRGERAAISSSSNLLSVRDGAQAAATDTKLFQLASVESEPRNGAPNPDPESPRPSTSGPRPALKRVK